MRVRGHRLRRAAGFLIGALLAASARAEEAEVLAPAETAAAPRAEHSWVPGVSFFGVGLVEERDASVSSDLRGSLSGSTRAVIGGFGGSFELSSPVLPALPGRSRVFAHADASFLPDPEEPVVNEGDPGHVEVQTVAGTNSRPVAGAQGRGSATRVEAKSLLLSAGVGLSFELEAWERSVRLKPSLEWQWQEHVVHALLGEVESENPADPLRCDFSVGCRTLEISSRNTLGNHALGLGLEVETDAGRIGDFLFSVFASSQTYRVLGDRRLEFTATGNWVRELDGQPSTRAPSSVTSSFELARWQCRFGVGMRILWRPE